MDELNSYDYQLPEELIAQEPCRRREDARLLVVDRESGRFEHRSIGDLPEFLNPGDCLILNDTRVIPARLLGRRTATGGRWEGLYLGGTTSGGWRLISQCRGKLRVGEQITVTPAEDESSNQVLELTLTEQQDEGVWIAEPASHREALELLGQFGTLPLPPYIGRKIATKTDWERYQTTFAQKPGAVAAPTAGLHFTPELLKACGNRGVQYAFVTLHVGLGTFRPVTVEKLSEHRMHAEWCELSAETAARIHATQQQSGRIVAVGTTTVRTLESVAQTGALQPWQGETDLFIRPPYQFRAVDCLLTNFHLPRSTLFVMVCTLAGRELMRAAYMEAILEEYRFFSYGDAMLIL